MGARHHSIQRRFLNSEQNKNLVHFDKLGKQGRTGLSKGLAKLGNIVAETMFLVMFPEGWLNWETYVSDAKFVWEAKCF